MRLTSIVFSMLVMMTSFVCASETFDKKFEAYNRLLGPGFSALVIKDGKVVYEKGFGYASLKKSAKKNPITKSTNFNIASNSKQFTAMGILLLEHQGKISSEDYLIKFIPEAPEYMKQIKIKHLIHHTSGLPDYMEICQINTKVKNADILSNLLKKRN